MDREILARNELLKKMLEREKDTTHQMQVTQVEAAEVAAVAAVAAEERLLQAITTLEHAPLTGDKAKVDVAVTEKAAAEYALQLAKSSLQKLRGDFIGDYQPSHTEGETAKQVPIATANQSVVKHPRAKRRTWRDVAWPYIVETFKTGQYSTAKDFYRALESRTSANDSPFAKGTGPHIHSLYVREISETLTLKTIQNAWAEIKATR